MHRELAILASTTLAVGSYFMLYLVVRANRYSRFLARWANEYAKWWPLSRAQAIRAQLAFVLTFAWYFTTITAYMIGVDQTEWDVKGGAGNLEKALVLLWFVSMVVLAVLVVVVALTGRPRRLVIEPCRGMTVDEIEAWVDENAAVPERKTRRSLSASSEDAE